MRQRLGRQAALAAVMILVGASVVPAADRKGDEAALSGLEVRGGSPTVADVESVLTEIELGTGPGIAGRRDELRDRVPAILKRTLVPGEPLVPELLATGVPDLQRIALKVIHAGDTGAWLEEPGVLDAAHDLLRSNASENAIRLSTLSAFASECAIDRVLDAAHALAADRDPELAGRAAFWLASGMCDDIDALLALSRTPDEIVRREATFMLVEWHARELSTSDRATVAAHLASLMGRDDLPPGVRLGAIRMGSEVRDDPAVRETLLAMLEPARWFHVEYRGQPDVHSLPVVIDALDWGNDPDVRDRLDSVRRDLSLLDPATRPKVEQRLARVLAPDPN